MNAEVESLTVIRDSLPSTNELDEQMLRLLTLLRITAGSIALLTAALVLIGWIDGVDALKKLPAGIQHNEGRQRDRYRRSRCSSRPDRNGQALSSNLQRVDLGCPDS